MSSLHGNHLIAGRRVAPTGSTFQARNPSTSATLETSFGDATEADVDAALNAADDAFDALRGASYDKRAQFLDLLADKIMGLGDALLNQAHAETALPMARLTGERGRATGQCKLFAQLIREGSWAEARIDHAIPDRAPLPKPDVRRVMQPIGPVVIFGASNFPFAIGVVGTDTVCALAAGCPVVVKGHPAHPGTCEMLAGAVYEALAECGLPAGAFSLLHGKSNEMGAALVRHPLANAVAFTGSLIVMFVLAGIVVLYSKKRPKDAYLSWGEAMASSVFCTFGLFWAFGVVPHQWLTYSGSELAMRSDAILAGPGSTGLMQFSPIVISKQTLADLIAVGIYGMAFTLTVVLWAVWQNRGQKKTDEVEKSNYGRPLVKA